MAQGHPLKGCSLLINSFCATHLGLCRLGCRGGFGGVPAERLGGHQVTAQLANCWKYSRVCTWPCPGDGLQGSRAKVSCQWWPEAGASPALRQSLRVPSPREQGTWPSSESVSGPGDFVSLVRWDFSGGSREGMVPVAIPRELREANIRRTTADFHRESPSSLPANTLTGRGWQDAVLQRTQNSSQSTHMSLREYCTGICYYRSFLLSTEVKAGP